MKPTRPESHVNRIESAFSEEAILPWLTDADELPGMPQALHCQINDFSAGLVPRNYEPRYAYPLILWLSSAECETDEALGHIGCMSPQNYVGLAVEGCRLKSSDDESLSIDTAVNELQRLVEIEKRIVEAVRSFREIINVHTERIFIAGEGDGARTAMLVAMHQPEWFGGCISFAGSFPATAAFLPSKPLLSETRFWLSARNGRDFATEANSTRQAARQLIAGGADVTTRLEESRCRVTRSILRDVDDWLIRGILAVS